MLTSFFFSKVFLDIMLIVVGFDSFTDHTIVNNDQHVISYKVDKNNVHFSFDLRGDTTNNLEGKWPKLDTYTIWIDYNHNGRIDSLVDRSFSPIMAGGFYTVCKSLTLGEQMMSTCEFYFGGSCTKNFTSTAHNFDPHVFFEMTIPKSELSKDGKSVHLALDIVDGSGNRASYPAFTYKNPFAETIKLQLQ